MDRYVHERIRGERQFPHPTPGYVVDAVGDRRGYADPAGPRYLSTVFMPSFGRGESFRKTPAGGNWRQAGAGGSGSSQCSAFSIAPSTMGAMVDR